MPHAEWPCSSGAVLGRTDPASAEAKVRFAGNAENRSEPDITEGGLQGHAPVDSAFATSLATKNGPREVPANSATAKFNRFSRERSRSSDGGPVSLETGCNLAARQAAAWMSRKSEQPIVEELEAWCSCLFHHV